LSADRRGYINLNVDGFPLFGLLSITRVPNVRFDFAQQRFAAPTSDTNAVT
jgi:hypothetical protein